MASRKDYFFRQLVTEADLDAGFADLEEADRNLAIDFGLVGVAQGLTVSQHSPQNLTVDVAGGQAYDQLGQRCNIATTQVLDVSVDSSSVSTSVAAPGNEKWVSVFIKFARALSDPQLDGNNVTVFFVRDESFSFNVVQGAEAAIGLAVRPALGSDKILLCDINRTNGQTQILNANISTTRREAAFVVSAGGVSISAGTPEVAIQALVTALVSQAASGGADLIGIKARTAWLGGRTNAASTLFAAVDKIITDLAVTTATDDGAERIGVANGGLFSAATVSAALAEIATFAARKTLPNTFTALNSFSDKIILSGAGAGLIHRAPLIPADATGTITIESYDDVDVRDTLTADRVYTIANPAASSSDGVYVFFRRVNPDPDYKATFNRSGGTQLFEFPVNTGSWAVLKSKSSSWYLVAWGGGTTINEASG